MQPSTTWSIINEICLFVLCLVPTKKSPKQNKTCFVSFGSDAGSGLLYICSRAAPRFASPMHVALAIVIAGLQGDERFEEGHKSMQPIFEEKKKSSTQDTRIAARMILCRRLHNQ